MIASLLILAAQIYAPPTAPPIKSGTFRCKMADRAGESFVLLGTLGNWRQLSGGALTDVSIVAPADRGLPSQMMVAMKPGQGELSHYDASSGVRTSGLLDIGPTSDGRLMLEQDKGMGVRVQYVGFCTSRFSTSAETGAQ